MSLGNKKEVRRAELCSNNQYNFYARGSKINMTRNRNYGM